MPVQQRFMTSPTTRLMFALAIVTGFGGPIAGVVLMVHTAQPGCPGWVGCGTNHPLMGVGIACLVAGLLLAVVFGTLARLSRSVAEMRTRVD